MKTWKTMQDLPQSTSKTCVEELCAQGYRVSDWIIDIVNQPNFDDGSSFVPSKLIRLSTKHLGFHDPAELQEIYRKIIDFDLALVPPLTALSIRFIYPEQKTGEWLRIATPMNSMIDSDGVPHLPKLGRALGKYYLETYWSYAHAIFHPHNEFVVIEP